MVEPARDFRRHRTVPVLRVELEKSRCGSGALLVVYPAPALAHFVGSIQKDAFHVRREAEMLSTSRKRQYSKNQIRVNY